MSPVLQRFLIASILLVAFTGRIAIYAMPLKNLAATAIKSTSDNKAEPLEKEDYSIEKVKLADVIMPGFTKFDFFNLSYLISNPFRANYSLTSCDVRIPEQPPK